MSTQDIVERTYTVVICGTLIAQQGGGDRGRHDAERRRHPDREEFTVDSTFAVSSRPRALPEWAFDHIAAGILSGEYRAGENLSDNAISVKLGISRSPVREALQALSRIGIVEISPSRFTRVVEFGDSEHRGVIRYAGRLAALALSEALPSLDPSERKGMATAVTKIGAIGQGQDHSAAIDGFLALLSSHVVHPVQRRHLRDVRLGVRCGVRFGPSGSVDFTRLQAASAALSEGIRAADAAHAAPAVRALFDAVS